MHWFKIHHGFSGNPKFGLVANQAGISKAIIIAISIELLEYASKNSPRGSIEGFDEDEASYNLGIEIVTLRNALQLLRNRGFCYGNEITNWEHYQGSGDATNADRQRRHREKKKQDVVDKVTDVTERNALRNTEKIREDKNRIDKKERIVGTRFALQDPPAEWIAYCELTRPDLNATEVFAGFRDYWIAKAGKDGVKLDWLATWRNWIRNQKREHKASVFMQKQETGVETIERVRKQLFGEERV